MESEGRVPLESLRPGWMFLIVLALCLLAGLAIHALLVRRYGSERFDRVTRGIEGTLFVFLLAGMLILSSLQVILRNLFHGGIIWLDPMTRTLVLWVAFLGALAATSHARHLHIDVVHRMLPAAIARRVGRLLSTFAAVICALSANAAYIYLREEYLYGTSPFLGVPAWVTQSILLWGFALLSYRFLVQTIWPTREEHLA